LEEALNLSSDRILNDGIVEAGPVFDAPNCTPWRRIYVGRRGCVHGLGMSITTALTLPYTFMECRRKTLLLRSLLFRNVKQYRLVVS